MSDTATRVNAALRWMRNKAGGTIPFRLERDALVPAAVPNGRVVVAPGQSVEPDKWGNLAYDQTVMVFTSASQRSQQWPQPLEGARSFLVDHKTAWIFRNGSWRIDPFGYMASVVGPAAIMDISTTTTTVLSLAFPAIAGRNYEIGVTGRGDNFFGTYPAQMTLTVKHPRGTQYLARAYNVPSQFSTTFNDVAGFVAASTATVTVLLQASSGPNTLRFSVNSCHMTITDQGAP